MDPITTSNVQRFALEQVPLFSSLDRGITARADYLLPFLTPPPDLEAIQRQVKIKSRNYQNRAALIQIVEQEYAGLPLSPLLQKNLELLKEESTFCVTTAHQPLLFGGKIYFLLKALSTIKLANTLSIEMPGIQVVPIFILGTEDHDLEEVRHVQVFNETLTWNPEASGPVGRMSLSNISELINEVKRLVGDLPHSAWVISLLEKSYSAGTTFGQATRYFLHYLLGEMGLIVLDLDTPVAKASMKFIFKQEIKTKISNLLVSKTIQELNAAGVKTQANPRPINLFYLQTGLRTRIEEEQGGVFHALHTDLHWTEDQLNELIDEQPETISPNVIIRPLFQEIMLPNLVFVGGGGELAYWIQLGRLFSHFDLAMPILKRRHSGWLIDESSHHRLDRLGMTISDFFKPLDETTRNFVISHSPEASDFSQEKEDVIQALQSVRSKLQHVDATLERSYESAETQILKQLEVLEVKLVRGLKNKQEQEVQSIRNLYSKLLPEGQLQERHDSIIPWLARYGMPLVQTLLKEFDPLKSELVVIDL